MGSEGHRRNEGTQGGRRNGRRSVQLTKESPRRPSRSCGPPARCPTGDGRAPPEPRRGAGASHAVPESPSTSGRSRAGATPSHCSKFQSYTYNDKVTFKNKSN